MLCHSAENRTVVQYSSSGSAPVTEMSRLNFEQPIRSKTGEDRKLDSMANSAIIHASNHAIGTFTLTET